MSNLIKLERVRQGDFLVNYDNGLTKKSITFMGAKNGRTIPQAIPQEIYDWLMYSTTTFRDGELRIVDEQPNVEEIKAYIPDKEEYENNSHTREDVTKLLKGNINKMKSELKKVTSRSEKMFIKQIADELNTDGEGLPKGKNDFIEEWIKIQTEAE
ncbi:hypothetical protein ACQKNX_08180 [Lysinibacillus sp. NPDC093712]|uniref:hypothetical protein n=1 Tax=Lysinibacillus sp. NPDC093712 TaxID=3390579 RepID=UPI003CFC4524